ncbi:MAG: chemotaxis-specific protein-glutamate methyltransferase CheB [Bosea sp. (in: a-proteobacteria)]|jgi:two-component system chemotaxis response regulator CheB|uniref:chemotaxis-specific protein-glutamate methyltransferase CheB n=1 Tax=Bosea sp. (in: a-proteobacteria) TaxID=1871050 RepID=UPI001DAF6F75|nr:chemotaxis-specific protein-glutamate methyltransferase CheB [Bosea sp. (in: a-proteobacteria)]MBX9876808.1 chemotaxis-specific protein-glutamate methyltransferase CheB [Beijerinckiaceae bacterium]MDP3601604.1 chemotaxis-specific protein-glutamate methyltransferase CheB [Bosea sp. (in: a-proteobacteria)]WRH59905.1 MAG: chemotaxis-specific protein-glutamate methyltransferase CheB [Bosea sp. (in: a-proteobacteria)]
MTGMSPSAANPVKVLVVDDSVLMQKLMTQIIDGAPGFKVIGIAGSAEEGWDKIQELRPDVVTLDLELPGRHGLKLLARVLKQDPLPVLIVSAFGGPGADNTIQALELGAIDFIEKPDGTTHTLEGFMKHLVGALQRASASRRMFASRRESAPARVAAPREPARMGGKASFIAIGASTGGVPAVQVVMRDLAHLRLPIAVVQHMPPGYTAKFAARLATATGLDVREASDGDKLKPGMAVVAPGGPRHLEIEERRGEFVCMLREGPLVSGHSPSVDVMFHSVARSLGANAIGILLTGMGRDGAEGLLAMRKAGAETLIQSGETCVVNGMPKAAFEIGAADRVVALDQIGAAVSNLLGERSHLRTA